MDIKDVLKRLRGHIVKVCFFVPETSIDECVQGVLREVDDNTVLLENMGFRLWITHVVVYLVVDFGHIDVGRGYGSEK